MGLLVILNNYLHDLAAGTWLSANVFQYVFLRRAGNGDLGSMRSALRSVRWISRIALVWIVIGGVIRALTYRAYEWSDAAGRGQVKLLAVKHILLGAAVAAGLVIQWRVDRMWRRAE